MSGLPTYIFSPKSLTRRYARLGTSALNWWSEQVESNDSARNEEQRVAATLFLKHLIILFLGIRRGLKDMAVCKLMWREIIYIVLKLFDNASSNYKRVVG